MKICKYCGSENSSNNKFCIHCGAALEETAGGASTNRDYYARMHEEKRAEQAEQNESGERIIYTNVAPRSVALSVILTIATCGIYMLYWQYKLNNEVNDLAEDNRINLHCYVVFCNYRLWGKIQYFFLK